jgi:hypothetical protein
MANSTDSKTLLIIVAVILLFMYLQPSSCNYASKPSADKVNYRRRRMYETDPMAPQPPMPQMAASAYSGKLAVGQPNKAPQSPMPQMAPQSPMDQMAPQPPMDQMAPQPPMDQMAPQPPMPQMAPQPPMPQMAASAYSGNLAVDQPKKAPYNMPTNNAAHFKSGYNIPTNNAAPFKSGYNIPTNNAAPVKYQALSVNSKNVGAAPYKKRNY